MHKKRADEVLFCLDGIYWTNMDNNTESTTNQANIVPATIEVTESVKNLNHTKKHFLRVFLTTLPIFFGISVMFQPGLLNLFTNIFIDFSFGKVPADFSYMLVYHPWSFSPLILGPILSYFSAVLYVKYSQVEEVKLPAVPEEKYQPQAGNIVSIIIDNIVQPKKRIRNSGFVIIISLILACYVLLSNEQIDFYSSSKFSIYILFNCISLSLSLIMYSCVEISKSSKIRAILSVLFAFSVVFFGAGLLLGWIIINFRCCS